MYVLIKQIYNKTQLWQCISEAAVKSNCGYVYSKYVKYDSKSSYKLYILYFVNIFFK